MSIAFDAAKHAAEICGLRPYLMRVALARMRDRDTAEDVVQETLAAACGNGTAFGGRSSLRTWVTGILLHKLTDSFRAMGRDPLALRDESVDDGDGADFEHDGRWRAPPATWSDPELALSCSRFRSAFDAQLTKLPALQSRAFVMRELMGQEPDEICRMLGITHSNLWVLLHRARLGMRRGLDRDWFRADETAPG